VKGLAEQEADIVFFILEEGEGLYSYSDLPRIQHVVHKHIDYGTFMVIRDENGIVGVARWNWTNPDTIFILDVVVRKDARNNQQDIMRRMLLLGHEQMGFKYFTFGRFHKYPDREPRTYSVARFLKLKQEA
jgi:hypothetical protein